MNFTIDGVGLRTNDDPTGLFPSGNGEKIDPYDHQIEMARLISNKDNFVAMNTAPTGGGKTLSWVVPAHKNKLDALVAFPTNALVRDQKESIEEYRDKHCEDGELGIVLLNGEAVHRELKETPASLRKGDLIEHKVREALAKYDSVLALTTPDMFTVLRRGLHKNTYAKLATNHFDMVVFDEFHIADTKGWNSLLYLIDEMYADEYANASKFVFLSATPDEDIEERLQKWIQVPDYYDCSKAAKDGRKPWSHVEGKPNWRAVMPPVDLELRGGWTWRTADAILDDDVLPSILQYCREGRTVIIVDGISEIDRVYDELSKQLNGLNVERIDGLHKKNTEQKLREFDVLVSNKAVEVGIDFDVDQLLMSGYQYSSFLQRLGRLRNKQETLRAICYVPYQTLSGFQTELPSTQRMLGPDEPVPRWKFKQIANNGVFPKPRNPELFPQMYSTIEAAMHIDAKKQRLTDEKRREYVVDACGRMANHFFKPSDSELTGDDLQEIFNKGRSPLNKNNNDDDDDPFADTLTSYRNNGLSTLVYKYGEDEIQSYNLFYFLSNGRIEFVTESEFKKRVPDKHHKEIRQESRNSVGYCIYYGRRQTDDDEEAGRGAKISAPQALREVTDRAPEDREPVTISGLEIDTEEPIPGLEKLNAELVTESFLCYPIEGDSHTVQTDFNLDSFFFLQDLTDLRGSYSLALGLNALYLHCHVVKKLEDKKNSSIPVRP